MTENIPPQLPPASAPTAAADIPGQPFYERTRLHLKDLLHKKRQLERSLATTEETILNKETEYLEDTPAGNIIVGFENYTKNVGVGGGGRRGRGLGDGEGGRVFTRSSVTFRGGDDSPSNTAQSTPMAAMAPTPLSTSFAKGDGASNHATPTSATSASRTGNGAGKKNKKNDDSDGEGNGNGRDVKKVRTNFGAVRK